jgi:hypothetical protein
LSGHHEGLGPSFSFVRATVPQCLPERLEIMSYANEHAFFYGAKHLAYILAGFVTDDVSDETEKLKLQSVRAGSCSQ